jgi:hypothetical protein
VSENIFFGTLSAFFLASAIFHFLKTDIVEGFLTRPKVIKGIGLFLILISFWGFTQQTMASKGSGSLNFIASR